MRVVTSDHFWIIAASTLQTTAQILHHHEKRSGPVWRTEPQARPGETITRSEFLERTCVTTKRRASLAHPSARAVSDVLADGGDAVKG